jgi:hypothetical protein
MRRVNEDRDKGAMETLRSSLIMLCFGLAILAFLVAIERPGWFHLRPVSGTAAAMAKASDGVLRSADRADMQAY